MMKITPFKLIFLGLYLFSCGLLAETITIINTPPTVNGVVGTPTENVVTRAIGESLRVIVKPKANLKGLIKLDGITVKTGKEQQVLRYTLVITKNHRVETLYIPSELTIVADTQALSTDEATPIEIELSFNGDFNESTSFQITQSPRLGQLSQIQENRVTYFPYPTYSGEDQFSFTVTDNSQTSAPASINLFIIKDENAPIPESRIALEENKITLADGITRIVKGEILILKQDSTTHLQMLDFIEENNWSLVGYVAELGSYQVDTGAKTEQGLLDKLEVARASALVHSVTLNKFSQLNFSLNDRFLIGQFEPNQWALNSINIDGAWGLIYKNTPEESELEGVSIGIIDGGYRFDHEDLRLDSRSFSNGIRPISSAAPNFCYYTGLPGEACKAPGHGMHVAGIIAASGNNGKGIAGVAYKNPLKPISYETDLSRSDIFIGLQYLIDEKVKIINISLGIGLCQKVGAGDKICNPQLDARKIKSDLNTLKQLEDITNSNQVLFVQASGNDGEHTFLGSNERINADYSGYFASLVSQLDTNFDDETEASIASVRERTLIVGAYESNITIESYPITNYTQIPSGFAGEDYPFILAPGGSESVKVLSTTYDEDGTDYDYRGGTSMAAPHVTGVAALVWQANPNLSAPEVQSIILDSATMGGAGNVKYPSPYRYLNAQAAVEMALDLLDKTAPVITINGSFFVDISQGENYNDAGATAVDDVDGTVDVTSLGQVDTDTIGRYTITYSAKDAAGNIATIQRTINVTEASEPSLTIKLTLPSSDVYEGGAIQLTALITNEGTAMSSASSMYFYLNNTTLLCQQSIPALSAGAIGITYTGTCDITAPATAGSYSYSACLQDNTCSEGSIIVKPTLSSLSISGADSINENSSFTYSATAHYSDGNYDTVNPVWRVYAYGSPILSLPSNTHIDANGKVSVGSAPYSDGFFEISASYQGQTVTKRVRVKNTDPVATSLVISGADSINEDSSATYSATAYYADGSHKTVIPTWSMSVPLVLPNGTADIDANGLVSVASLSSDKDLIITAGYDGQTATKSITVKNIAPTLTSLTISGASSINEGSYATYTVKADYSDGNQQTVIPSWSETSPYLSIDSSGKATASLVTANKTAIITASYGGKTATKSITINNLAPTLSSLSISGASSINEGNYATYSVTAYYSDGYYDTVSPTWTENSFYLSIDSSGKATASLVSTNKTAIITASYGGKTATKSITINNLAPTLSSLSISGASSINEGSYSYYSVKANYSDGSQQAVIPSWSENSPYLGIDSSGKATASLVSANNTATITASYGGKTATKSITINNLAPTLSSLSISGASSINEGSSVTYTAIAYYSDGSNKTVNPSWGMSGSPYGTVDFNGKATASLVDSDTVFNVTANYRGKTATKSVTIINKVTVPVSKIKSYSQGSGDLTLYYDINDSDGDHLEWMALGIVRPDGTKITLPTQALGSNSGYWNGIYRLDCSYYPNFNANGSYKFYVNSYSNGEWGEWSNEFIVPVTCYHINL